MQPNKKKSVSVKDKLDGNELDLSLLELTEVPVKEMAAVTRGTVVDLSNNKLVSLPMTFPTLVHIVKLDLSKNQLTSLPPNFGDLRNLKHLDLYSNKLERVPVSFYQLKELRWLDLKNNPLVPTLAEAAGNCLDSKECYDAAKKVVKLMAMVHAELEKKRIQELEEEKAQKQAQKVKADREKEEIRLQKKATKEKRKAEAASKQNTETARTSEIKTIDNELQADSQVQQPTVQTKNHRPAKKDNPGPSWCRNFFHIMLRLLTLAVVFATALLALHWEGPLTYDNLIVVSDRTYDNIYRFSLEMKEWSQPHIERMQDQWKHLSRFVAENGRDIMNIAWLKIVHWAGVLQEQSLVLFAVLRERGSEWLVLGGAHAARMWDVVCEQAPIYYDLAISKIQELYKSAIAMIGN